MSVEGRTAKAERDSLNSLALLTRTLADTPTTSLSVDLENEVSSDGTYRGSGVGVNTQPDFSRHPNRKSEESI